MSRTSQRPHLLPDEVWDVRGSFGRRGDVGRIYWVLKGEGHIQIFTPSHEGKAQVYRCSMSCLYLAGCSKGWRWRRAAVFTQECWRGWRSTLKKASHFTKFLHLWSEFFFFFFIDRQNLWILDIYTVEDSAVQMYSLASAGWPGRRRWLFSGFPWRPQLFLWCRAEAASAPPTRSSLHLRRLLPLPQRSPPATWLHADDIWFSTTVRGQIGAQERHHVKYEI